MLCSANFSRFVYLFTELAKHSSFSDSLLLLKQWVKIILIIYKTIQMSRNWERDKMRIEQLEYFLDVAKTKSLNASAERLFVTQPTISEAIHRLEEELESDLLLRSSKGVALSEVGQIVQCWAQIILGNIEQMKEEVWRANDNYNPQLQGDLCIGATNLSDNIVVPKILKDYMKYYPKVNLRVFNIRHYEISTFIDDGTIDLAIFNWFDQDLIPHIQSEERELIFNDERLNRVMLGQESLQVVAHKNLPISRQKVVSLADVIKYPLILHLSYVKTEKEIMRFFKTLGNIQVALQADNIKLLRQAVLDERGIGLFSKSSFGNIWFEDVTDNEVMRVIRLKERLSMSYFLAYAQSRKQTMAAKTFVDHAKNYCDLWLGK